MTDLMQLMSEAKRNLLQDREDDRPLIHFMHPNEYEFHKKHGNIRDGTMHGPPIMITRRFGEKALTLDEYEAKKLAR